MYSITREKAASMLNISTRSVDRYIRAWKLRSQKKWKIVYINEDDINNFLWIGNKKQEVIIWKPGVEEEKSSLSLSKNDDRDFWIIFEKLRQEIKAKDEEIKELSVKIWKMEEILKNSISIVEFKKTQFLLEESKNSLNSELEYLKKELQTKDSNLKEEKKLNYILILVSILLFIVLIVVWIIKI